MKITVAGKDRTAEIGQQIAADAARLKATCSIDSLSPEHSALLLKQAASRDDYTRRFIGLLRIRHGARTTDFYIPRGPGLKGKVAVALKSFLWKLLRYQHDRMAYQQNLINELAINALEFQQDQLSQELADLKQRVEGLEKGRSRAPVS